MQEVKTPGHIPTLYCVNMNTEGSGHMAKESFLRGAVILAAASAVSRIIGIIYMVVLPRIIYDDGMACFNWLNLFIILLLS